MLRWENPSGKCAKPNAVAESSKKDHAPWSLQCCMFVPLVYGCCSPRTSHSWWIAHSTPRQSIDCNNTHSIYNVTHRSHLLFVGSRTTTTWTTANRTIAIYDNCHLAGLWSRRFVGGVRLGFLRILVVGNRIFFIRLRLRSYKLNDLFMLRFIFRKFLNYQM